MIDHLNTWARKVPTWVVWILGLLPVPWLLYQGFTGGLGVDPAKALEHELGETALQILIGGLCITPLRRFAGLNLLRFRRTVGLLAFTYVALHLLTWLVLDVQILAQVWADILKRPYITIGMAAFVLMIPLAVTSTNGWIKRLGPNWKRLHKLTYLVAVLGGLHFVLLAKGFQIEPLLYLGGVLGLLAVRLVPRRKAGNARNRPMRSPG